MVLAISLLEAPLKFRAEGLEVRVGLAIAGPSVPVLILAALTAVLLAVQLLLVRPRLNQRSARVLAGEDAPRSRAHHAYIGLEALKIATLVALGATLLAT